MQNTKHVEGQIHGQEYDGDTQRPTKFRVALEALEGSKTISQLSKPKMT